MAELISLQVKYAAQAFLTGDIIAARESDHVYREGDCKKAWIEAGRTAESWKSTFAIIYISDETNINHPDLQKLLIKYSDDPDSPYKRKYFLQMPSDESDPHRISIIETGETIATIAEVVALTSER